MGVYSDALYTRIYYFFKGDEALMGVVGSYVLMTSIFWLANSALLYTDITGKPQWMKRYKVQKDQNVPVDRSKLRKALKTVVFNNLFLNALISYPIFRIQQFVGCSFSPEELPTAPQMLGDLLVCVVMQEIVFYYSHRLFHHPLIYQAVHKKHHEWTAPVGIVAIYTSPVEYLTGNMISVLLGPVVMRSHIVTFWLWYAISNIGTTVHHSGYHLPLLPSPEYHDYHHPTFNGNFGTFGVLDWLHGTDAQFRNSVQSKRHRTLFGLTPMPEIYPDNKKT